MKKIFDSNKVYVAQSQIANAGRGVYAKIKIKTGELIERCPVIALSEDDTAYLNESNLVTYLFYFGKDKNQALISLGFGSIYNHCEQANAVYEIKDEEKVMEITAIEDINENEEITVDYNCGNPKRYPMWFE